MQTANMGSDAESDQALRYVVSLHLSKRLILSIPGLGLCSGFA